MKIKRTKITTYLKIYLCLTLCIPCFGALFVQVGNALTKAAWGNQYHLFTLSMALRRPIYCFPSFLRDEKAAAPEQRWSAGQYGTLQELKEAFHRRETGTGGATKFVAVAEDSDSRPLVVFLSHGHFSALLPKPGYSLDSIPIPHLVIMHPLRSS